MAHNKIVDKVSQISKETVDKCDVVFDETLFEQSAHVVTENCRETIYIEDNNMYVPIYINDVKDEQQDGDYIDDEINVYNVSISDELYNSVNYLEDEVTIEGAIIANLKEDPCVTNYFITDVEHGSSRYSYCDGCGSVYEWFCSKCNMVLQILDSYVPENSDDRPEKTIPGNILEINKSAIAVGVYTLTSIPKGIRFGPFEGLQSVQCTTGSAWKLENGKPVLAENGKSSNWMQYVNCVRNISATNLVVFQYENNLYYRADREIMKGEELLVYSGADDRQAYYYPEMEQDVHDLYACTFCCLGFSSAAYLLKHKENCAHTTNKDGLPEDLVQCAFCKIHLYETEYSRCHMNNCCQNYTRKCKLSTATADRVVDDMSATGLGLEASQHDENNTHSLKRGLSTYLRFKCKTCNKLCTETLDPSDPTASNVANKQFICSKCANSAHVTTCMVAQDSKDGVNPYQCTICMKKFGFKHRLRSHLKYAHSAYIAEDCRKKGRKSQTSQVATRRQ